MIRILPLFSSQPGPQRLCQSILVALALAISAAGPLFADGFPDDPVETFNELQLIDYKDLSLQDGLEKIVGDLGLSSFAAEDRLAICLVDITDLQSPRFASLNPHHMMYAASLPKIAILLGAFVKIDRGELVLDEPLRQEMVKMIRYSDNHSATKVLSMVGRNDLIDILQSEQYRLYDPEQHGGLWVGKDYAKKGAYRRDPLNNLSHGATVYQAARFFYLLESGQLVSDESRREMKEILDEPGIKHKFVKGLQTKEISHMFRKSGTWKDYHADAVMVEAGDKRYILVGLAHHESGGQWLVQLAPALHELVVQGGNPSQ